VWINGRGGSVAHDSDQQCAMKVGMAHGLWETESVYFSRLILCESLRAKSGNIIAPFRKIVTNANAQPWPRPWQNMRSSCETDLAAKFPVYLVGVWLRKSAIVAAKH